MWSIEFKHSEVIQARKPLLTLLILITIVFSTTEFHADDEYMHCKGKTTTGKKVIGECYLYSSTYGDFSGRTENGEEATGKCYKSSKSSAELEFANTKGGEKITGKCYP
jgi:hypothetical protein